MAALRQALTASLVAAMLGLFCRSFVVQPIEVHSGSMRATLLPGDHVLFSRLIYATAGWAEPLLPVRAPRRGDVVLLHGPGRRAYVKRCVALPGDRVEIRRGHLVIDGRELREPWARIRVGDLDVAEVMVGADRYFVLGDDRGASRDSRHWGTVDRQQLLGKATVIYWSVGSPTDESRGGWDKLVDRWLNWFSSIRWDRWWWIVR